MTKLDHFTVGFRGDFSTEEEYALMRAGYRVYRDAIHPVLTMWDNDPSTAQVHGDSRPRHIITAVPAEGVDDAVRRVKRVIGREQLDDLDAAPGAPSMD